MITCLIISHDKRHYLRQAVESLLAQTFPHWRALLIDSGVLLSRGQLGWVRDERITIIRSEETEETRQRFAIAPWCLNENLHRVTSDLVTYLCDDDILYPDAYQAFANYYTEHPNIDAMYGSVDLVTIEKKESLVTKELLATRVRHAGEMDCQVDYLQFAHTRRILERLPARPWPEGRGDTETHADGVFMESVARLTPVYPVQVKVGQNRRTPESTYRPS